MRTMNVFGCVLALCCATACSGTPATTIQPEEIIKNGTPGAPGSTGAPGATGKPGAPGSTGGQGTPGATGPIACGTVQIDPSVFGSSCGGGTLTTANPANGLFAGWYPNGSPVCLPGTVQCQLSVGAGALEEVCADANGQWSDPAIFVSSLQSATFTQNTVVGAAGTRCDEDLDCNNVADDTTGVGANVSLTKPALTYLPSFQNSQSDSGVIVFAPGVCRNATAHCITADTWCETVVVAGAAVVSCDGFGNPISGPVSGDREGVVLSDFGDLSYTCSETGCALNTPVGDEALMGEECTDASGTVRVYACSADASGVVSVGCTGAAQ